MRLLITFFNLQSCSLATDERTGLGEFQAFLRTSPYKRNNLALNPNDGVTIHRGKRSIHPNGATDASFNVYLRTPVPMHDSRISGV
jgi:hypothetical protein